MFYSFFGGIEDTKKTFQNQLTFSSVKKSFEVLSYFCGLLRIYEIYKSTKKRGGLSGSAGITRTTSLKNKSVGNYRRTRRNTEDNLNFGDIPEQGNLIGDTDNTLAISKLLCKENSGALLKPLLISN